MGYLSDFARICADGVFYGLSYEEACAMAEEHIAKHGGTRNHVEQMARLKAERMDWTEALSREVLRHNLLSRSKEQPDKGHN